MANKICDLCYKSGEYQTRDGQSKNRWENVGAIFDDGKGGMFVTIKTAFNPAGIPDRDMSRDSVILSAFRPKDKNNGNQSQGGYSGGQNRNGYGNNGYGGQKQGGYGGNQGYAPQQQDFGFDGGDSGGVPF